MKNNKIRPKAAANFSFCESAGCEGRITYFQLTGLVPAGLFTRLKYDAELNY